MVTELNFSAGRQDRFTITQRKKNLINVYFSLSKMISSGLDSALFGISLTNYCYYYFYEFTKSIINKAQMSTLESMSAGAVAGGCHKQIKKNSGSNRNMVTANLGSFCSRL